MSRTIDQWEKDIKSGLSKQIVLKYAKSHLFHLKTYLSQPNATNEFLSKIANAITDTENFIKKHEV